MAKETAKPVYKASDGTHHDSKLAAEKASELHAAAESFSDCLGKLNRAMLKSAQTADGHYLEWKIQDLYYVHTPYGQLPRLRRIYFWPMNVSIDRDRGKGGAMMFREYDHERREYHSYYVNELYADQGEARKALIAASKEKLQEFHRQFELMKEGKVDCLD